MSDIWSSVINPGTRADPLNAFHDNFENNTIFYNFMPLRKENLSNKQKTSI